MGKIFVVDVAKCTGCYNCQLVCKDEHCDNDWRPYAAPQPDTGQFWCKLEEHLRGTTPKVKIHYIARLCGHCDNASCMSACDVDAITKRDDGLVIIDPDKCNGCMKCVSACPYEAIYINKELNIAQKCTGCAHLLDNGTALPRCVEACPTDAMMFGEEEDFADMIKEATIFNPEAELSPRIYYLNIPGRFIGGTVYDPVIKEVVIGAKCSLTCVCDCNAGECDCKNDTIEAETNDFGDFWFKDLAEEKFSLTIAADGYEDLVFKDLDTSNDINLGDIPMIILPQEEHKPYL